MNQKHAGSQGGGISLADVYFVLFRQKWLILAFSVAGIMGAILLLFVVRPPQYQSDALLSIRYVVEGKSLNPPGDQANTRPLDEQSASIIHTEIATLNSQDLAKQVVQAMTPEKILAKTGGGADFDRAVQEVSGGISVESIPESSVIHITYQNQDVALVQPVLNEIIVAYLAKHVELHQGMGASNVFLTNEVVRLQNRLAQTYAELRKIKNAAGVVSLDDTPKAYAEQISEIRQNIFNSEAELAERQAVVEQMMKASGTQAGTTNVVTATEVPAEQLNEYTGTCATLTYLEGKERDYLTRQGFTVENVLVKQNHELIEQNQALKTSLEQKYPGLLARGVFASGLGIGQPGSTAIDLKTESEQVSALRAKIQVLNSQLAQVWTDATNFEKVAMTISELQQKKDVDEGNLKYYMKSLEEAGIDAALGVDKAANISIVQSPTSPSKGWSKAVKKKAEMAAAGGVFGGLALAFLIELLLDRSVKRPADVETKLRLPLFISIPDVTRNGHRNLGGSGNHVRAKGAADNQGESAGAMVLHPTAGMDFEHWRHPFRRFSEGLRDRLIVYFETRNLNHKPKLVAVTSCNKGAGVSTIAAGVAASLSETGDGNVLLVNISGEQGAAQQFYKGKAGYSLDEALSAKTSSPDKNQGAFVKANLYTTVEQAGGDMLPANLPKKISALMPKLKASEYDYIIFDMPPVNQTSVTARLSGLMDMVLLVLEAEKTNLDVVERANQLLAESKATVGTVLNKTRNYIPARLHQEYLNDI